MREINKPAATKYWVIEGGGVVICGQTLPNQVTTTGLGDITAFDTEGEALTHLQSRASGVTSFDTSRAYPARG